MNEDALRRRIVQYALPRFFAKGFRAVRTEDLASALGISKKTIYRLFRDKKEILRAAVRIHLEAIDRELTATFDLPEANFRQQMGTVFRVWSERLAPIEPVFLTDLFRLAPEVWEEIDAFRTERVFPRLVGAIQTGIREGYVRSDVDVDLLVRLLFATLRRAVTPEALSELQAPLSAIIRHIQILLFQGLLTDKGRRAWENSYET